MLGTLKGGRGTLVGNAGEHYVMAELLKRGVIAALAPRNSPAYDVLATLGLATARIRVKTKSKDQRGWQWNAKKDGTIFPQLLDQGDFTVLVHLAMNTADLAFFVVPTRLLNEVLVEDFRTWIETPGVHGQPHDPDNTYRFLVYTQHAAFLDPFKGKWDELWK